MDKHAERRRRVVVMQTHRASRATGLRLSLFPRPLIPFPFSSPFVSFPLSLVFSFSRPARSPPNNHGARKKFHHPSPTPPFTFFPSIPPSFDVRSFPSIVIDDLRKISNRFRNSHPHWILIPRLTVFRRDRQ